MNSGEAEVVISLIAKSPCDEYRPDPSGSQNRLELLVVLGHAPHVTPFSFFPTASHSEFHFRLIIHNVDISWARGQPIRPASKLAKTCDDLSFPVLQRLLRSLVSRCFQCFSYAES